MERTIDARRWRIRPLTPAPCAAGRVTANLWIDVDDLFEYARGNARPSGIQRMAFEIYRALQQRDAGAGTVHFIRHAPGNSFRVVPWSEVVDLFESLTGGVLPAAAPPPAIPQDGSGRLLVRRLLHRLPSSLRLHVIDVLVSTATAARAWAGLVSALRRGVQRAPRRLIRRLRGAGPVVAGPEVEVGREVVEIAPSPAHDPAAGAAFAAAAPGDVLVVLGSPWSHPSYAALIRTQREKRGLRFALLVYDLIPLRRPEWCDAGLVRVFRTWFDTVFPLCDYVFAISRATAADVEAYAAERGIALPGAVAVIPIGTGLSSTPAAGAPSGRVLPPVGSYALIVSTIEARKNHLLLFRVWRRLLEELPHEQVPTLVFAGRVGWLVDDLMRQITNTGNLGGKLVLIEIPTDAELATLYSGCLFTLFPSFFEGWGLPVSESLAYGKPCLISDRTSLPEAGGTLARRFDPDNLHDAYAVIRDTIEDRAGLARWEAQVRREFKPVPWSASAEALLAGLCAKQGQGSALDPLRAEPLEPLT